MELHLIAIQSITCRMGSHSVTYHTTQVNTPRITAGQTAPIQVLTGPSVG